MAEQAYEYRVEYQRSNGEWAIAAGPMDTEYEARAQMARFNSHVLPDFPVTYRITRRLMPAWETLR